MYKEILTALENKQVPTTSNMRSEFTREVVESYDPKKATALIRRFQKNGTWQCPTLVALHTLWADREAQYTSEDLRSADRLLARNAEIIAMQRGGVRLLAGTDLPPGTKNGTIHDELASLLSG